jgi:transcriptional regulator with XRE-family HTH domain
VSSSHGASPVGARIRRLRIQAGLTQQDLAGTAVTARTISRIELGRVVPSRRTAEHIAGRLGCRVEDILGDDSSPSDAEVEADIALARLHRIRGEHSLAREAALRAHQLAMRTGIRRLEAAAALEVALARHGMAPSPASEAAVLEAARRAMGESLIQEAARAISVIAVSPGQPGARAGESRRAARAGALNGKGAGGGEGTGGLHRIGVAVEVLAAWAEERSRKGAFAEAAWAARIAARLAEDGGRLRQAAERAPAPPERPDPCTATARRMPGPARRQPAPPRARS